MFRMQRSIRRIFRWSLLSNHWWFLILHNFNRLIILSYLFQSFRRLKFAFYPVCCILIIIFRLLLLCFLWLICFSCLLCLLCLFCLFYLLCLLCLLCLLYIFLSLNLFLFFDRSITDNRRFSLSFILNILIYHFLLNLFLLFLLLRCLSTNIVLLNSFIHLDICFYYFS